MAKVTAVEIGYGSIQFISKVEPTPTTTQRMDNVTVNNVGRPGVPAHFTADFLVGASIEEGVHAFTSWFNVKTLVQEPDPDASFSSVETVAATQLVDILRQVAANIETQMEEAAIRRAKIAGT